jgi:hypothetical protein
VKPIHLSIGSQETAFYDHIYQLVTKLEKWPNSARLSGIIIILPTPFAPAGEYHNQGE